MTKKNYWGGEVADLRILVDGRDADTESLQDWLRNDPDLSAHLRHGEQAGPAGSMGVSTELIVGIVSSGAATALVRSLQVWLTQRRADVKLDVEGPQGRHVVLDAKRVRDAEQLVNAALGWAEEGLPPSAG